MKMSFIRKYDYFFWQNRGERVDADDHAALILEPIAFCMVSCRDILTKLVKALYVY